MYDLWRYARLIDNKGNENLITFNTLENRKEAVKKTPRSYTLIPVPVSKISNEEKREIGLKGNRFYSSEIFVWCLEIAGISLKTEITNATLNLIDAMANEKQINDAYIRDIFETSFKPDLIEKLGV